MMVFRCFESGMVHHQFLDYSIHIFYNCDSQILKVFFEAASRSHKQKTRDTLSQPTSTLCKLCACVWMLLQPNLSIEIDCIAIYSSNLVRSRAVSILAAWFFLRILELRNDQG